MSADHPGPLLSSLLDGHLGTSERSQVLSHLEHCRSCLVEADGLARARAGLRAMPTRTVPAAVLGHPRSLRVGPDPDGEDTPLAASRARRRSRLAGVVAGALALLGAGAMALGGAPERQAPVVQVPVEVFVADHLGRSASSPAGTPVLVEGARWEP